jgi:serine/threonine protein kinase
MSIYRTATTTATRLSCVSTAAHTGVEKGPDEVPLAPVDAWPLRLRDPRLIDGYQIMARLGTGGMADVFYALAPGGDPLAIKVLSAVDGAPDTCQREYHLARTVDTSCTAPVLGYGRSKSGPYLLTAYLPGYRSATTLTQPIPDGPLWRFGAGLAATLAAVHNRGIVHCDVKPSNLLVRDCDVRVIDFGIARRTGERCHTAGMVQLSRGWAAPEQLRDVAATPAIDIFAWGCVMAYLASGRRPFASRDDQEWILRVQSREPDLAGISADLRDLIHQTLQHAPRDRPTASSLAAICVAQSKHRVPPSVSFPLRAGHPDPWQDGQEEGCPGGTPFEIHRAVPQGRCGAGPIVGLAVTSDSPGP